jgi:hypothetical protein
MARRTIYRDSNSGRFVSKQKWARSHAKGGERYKRQQIEIREREPEPEPELPGEEIREISSYGILLEEIEQAEEFEEDDELGGAFDSP